MPAKRVTTIKIDPELWKKAKKQAIDRGITLSRFIEALLRKELGETERGGR
jgi:hypothetical protein